jgi:hypothetical protein
MIMLVLDDVDRPDDVLRSWSESGASGITSVEASRPHRRRSALGLVHARRNVENLGIESERAIFTLFGVVPDEATAQQCLAATELVVGDLAASGAGTWVAWPLAFVKGASPRPFDTGAG